MLEGQISEIALDGGTQRRSKTSRGRVVIGDLPQPVASGDGVAVPACRQAGEVQNPRFGHRSQHFPQFGASLCQCPDIEAGATEDLTCVRLGEHRGSDGLDANPRFLGVHRARIGGSYPKVTNFGNVRRAEEKCGQV